MAGPKEVSTALLPLTSRTLLVGRRQAGDEFDPALFNRAAAQCSHTYFLCASQAVEIVELTALIRQRSVLMVENAIESGLGAILLGAPKVVGKHRPPQQSTFNIPVSYRGHFDEESANRISRALSDLLSDVASIPLERLDGITIADDYVAALSTLDRGELGIGAAQSRQSDRVSGVAQPVGVNAMERLRVIL